MSKLDIHGLDAVELAIQGGHGELASCLLDQRGPASRNHLLCARYPLEVLELAIKSGNEDCARAVIASKRVVDNLQRGKTEHLNLIARWTQRQTPMKRLHNIFTCVGAAVRCGMTDIVEFIFKVNPDETRQAVWYTVYKLQSQTSWRAIEMSPWLQRMAKSYLLDKVWPQISAIVLLHYWRLVAKYERTGTTWPDEHNAIRLEDGKTVLMLVARVPDPQLAVKLIDFVCSHADNFWARDSHGRHVIMDTCRHGVPPSVLLRLLKWARRRSVKVIVPMSRQDVNGLDAVELAIQAGHGALASCLLQQHGPNSHDDLLCTHSPLQVLELAIESRNEQCAVEVLANKRVVGHLQPGSAKRLNLYMRWEQRRATVKRLFNIFTCVETATRCEMPGIVQRIYKLNPTETRQAAWYALHKLKLQALGGQELLQVPPVVCRMARRYLLDKAWPEIGAIILLRHGELLGKKKPALRERLRRWWRRGHRNGEAIAASPWTSQPTEMVWQILSFLLPSEKLEAKKMTILAEYNVE